MRREHSPKGARSSMIRPNQAVFVHLAGFRCPLPVCADAAGRLSFYNMLRDRWIQVEGEEHDRLERALRKPTRPAVGTHAALAPPALAPSCRRRQRDPAAPTPVSSGDGP